MNDQNKIGSKDWGRPTTESSCKLWIIHAVLRQIYFLIEKISWHDYILRMLTSVVYHVIFGMLLIDSS